MRAERFVRRLPGLLCLAVVLPGTAAPVAVRVAKGADGFQLLRDGRPYFIRGVGGDTRLPLLKQAGGNSIRTWGAENQSALLDRAQSLGLTVTLGTWLGHARHGFRYDDAAMVARQFEAARRHVRAYRDHPALLIWSIGNEMEGAGDDPRVWKAVNAIAAMVKSEDPNHPTMTVVAEVGGPKIAMLKAHCPAIDILGVNSYGGAASLPRRLKERGWDRPYVLTEFGALGPWEVAKTAWGAPLEATSTEKAARYESNYERAVVAERGRCLGAYAFLWGHKQEATATWFGMLLPGGERLGAVEVMTRAWTGRRPANRAPELLSLTSDAAAKRVTPGAELTATVTVRDPDGDPIDAAWELRSESADRRTGGDAEAAPPAHPDALLAIEGMTLRFRAPRQQGAYRLFVTLRDGKGNAATANFPFFAGL